MKNWRRKEGGFSLVELAISVTVIGILIAAVLKGKEILLTSRIAATVAQVDKYRAAMLNFENLYGGLPGDFEEATTQLLGCSGNATCADGDGNGYVMPTGAPPSDEWAQWTSRDLSEMAPETLQFWKHLAAVDLISDVDVASNTDVSSLAWHETHPSSPFGGGFEFYYDHSSTAGAKAHFLRLSRDGINNTRSAAEVLPILSPHDAHILDRKADDGKAWSGKIVVDYGTDPNSCHDGNEYLITETERACTVFFVFYK